MESMAAFRQKPKRLVLSEIVQTNGAIVSVDKSVALSIRERCDGVDDGLREADGADEPDGMIENRALIFVYEICRRSFRRPRISASPIPISGNREI